MHINDFKILRKSLDIGKLVLKILKKRIYDPYETEFDRHQWEMHNQYEILDNRYILKVLENEIKEVRKTIKKMNKEQNQKNNN